MSTYIETLRGQVAETLAARRTLGEMDPFAAKIRRWYLALPAAERRAIYTMDDLKQIFPTSTGRIGRALHQLGWTRRRSWRTGQPFSRYWVPADVESQGDS